MTSIWRKELPVKDEKTGLVLKGGMLKAQAQWWALPNFVKALIGGYGSGKTMIAAKRGIALALTNAPSPHLIVSPTYKIARRTIVTSIRQLLQGKQTIHPDLRYRFNKSSHEFTIWWRGREAYIWVASGDDPDALKGPNVGSAHIDEPFIQDEEVLDQVLARIRDPMARIKELGLSGTPEQLNWGYDICEGERAGDYDVGIVRALTRDNFALDPAYYERLASAFSEQAALAYLDGQFVNLTEGQVYYGATADNFVHLEDPGHELFVGMDFNVNPMAAVVYWVNGTHMHAIDEIELSNADTQEMCSYLRDKYTNEDGICRIRTIFPDASGAARHTSSPGGKSDFHYIREAGFQIDAPFANPLIRDRENAVNGKLHPKKGPITLTFEPKLRKLKTYLAKYTHEEKHTAEHKKMSHLLDAMGYPVHRLFPVTIERAMVATLSGH